MSGPQQIEIILYELLKARREKDEARAHLLVRDLSRRDLVALSKAMADVTVSALTEILSATGHEDPDGWVAGFLDRVSGEAVDQAVNAQVFEDPPPAA